MKNYDFNPSLDAKSVFKERLVWMLFMGILFFLAYGSANQFAFLTAPHPSIFMEWEKQIPFIPTFIIPYMSSDLLFIIAFLLPYTRLELRILATRVLFIVLFSSVFFVLMPLQFSFEKPHSDTFSLLFTILQADHPYNQLPSLHISFAIVLWASMKKYIDNSFLYYFTIIWFLLIAFSTLFVYQHHFIDIPTGVLVGIMALYIIKKCDKNNIFTNSFTTPRSIKMGFYYLFGSILFVLFYFYTFCIVFLWLFASCFAVSIIYAFGLNPLLAGNQAKANFLQWSLFLPYFYGNHLSWHYYKRKLPLITKLQENIYFGRMPTNSEFQELKKYKIDTIINLATEQQINKYNSSTKEYRLPFLDQTIQSPQMLHQGVLLIQENKKNQGILIHCALGLSRSALLIGAWLIYNGLSLEETQNKIEKICPKCVKSKYMKITLEIYANYLNTIRI